ncbi:MAG: LPS assembly lipoprotein LptE [Dysgonamonadaceae bacterium]|jgi:hypothetical protein|nr:LPS assembly lipoprotein LptE [Dysgonamonadaceae bacterium]
MGWNKEAGVVMADLIRRPLRNVKHLLIPGMGGSIKPVITAFLLVLLLSGCKVVQFYSFEGGRLNYDMVKTITIHEFPNRTPNYPLLSQVLDQALRKRYIEQTRLVPVDNNGDIEIEGEIINYNIQGMAVKENYESLTRLTITVKVKYANHKEANSDVDQTFSAFQEFDASRSIDEVQDNLIAQIVDELVDKIYNETVANW